MTTFIAGTATGPLPERTRVVLRRAQAALVVGAIAAVALAVIGLFVTTTSGDGHFHHAGDYWLTGDGIVYMAALLVLLATLRALQGGRDRRVGRAGMVVASVGAAVLVVMFVYGLIAATGNSFGPAYILAGLATLVGVALFAAGCWRARLLPRWLVPVWVLAWVIGGVLPVARPGPLLLAAVYLAIAAILPNRVAEAATPIPQVD